MAWTKEQTNEYSKDYQRRARANPEKNAKINATRRANAAKRRNDPAWAEEYQKRLAYQREWYADQPQAYRDRINLTTTDAWRLRHAGVTKEQWDERFERCNGKCEICSRAQGSGAGKVLGADHDHDTMVFRGIICGNCNRGIGLLGDNIEGLKNALAYLQRAT